MKKPLIFVFALFLAGILVWRIDHESSVSSVQITGAIVKELDGKLSNEKQAEAQIEQNFSNKDLEIYLDSDPTPSLESDFARMLTAEEKALVAEFQFSLHSISEDVQENTRDLIEFVKTDLPGHAEKFRSLWKKSMNIHSVKRDLLFVAGEAGMQDFRDIAEEALAEDPYPHALNSPTKEHEHHNHDEQLYFEEYSVQRVALTSLKKLATADEFKKILTGITMNCGRRHICVDAISEMMNTLKMDEVEILSWLPQGYTSVYFEVKN